MACYHKRWINQRSGSGTWGLHSVQDVQGLAVIIPHCFGASSGKPTRKIKKERERATSPAALPLCPSTLSKKDVSPLLSPKYPQKDPAEDKLNPHPGLTIMHRNQHLGRAMCPTLHGTDSTKHLGGIEFKLLPVPSTVPNSCSICGADDLRVAATLPYISYYELAVLLI